MGAPSASGSSASLIQVPLALPRSRTVQAAPSRSNAHWWWLTAGSAAAPVSGQVDVDRRARPHPAEHHPVAGQLQDSVGADDGERRLAGADHALPVGAVGAQCQA